MLLYLSLDIRLNAFQKYGQPAQLHPTHQRSPASSITIFSLCLSILTSYMQPLWMRTLVDPSWLASLSMSAAHARIPLSEGNGALSQMLKNKLGLKRFW
jgi:hypothetical protein